jgi:hypothetical protein
VGLVTHRVPMRGFKRRHAVPLSWAFLGAMAVSA